MKKLFVVLSTTLGLAALATPALAEPGAAGPARNPVMTPAATQLGVVPAVKAPLGVTPVKTASPIKLLPIVPVDTKAKPGAVRAAADMAQAATDEKKAAHDRTAAQEEWLDALKDRERAALDRKAGDARDAAAADAAAKKAEAAALADQRKAAGLTQAARHLQKDAMRSAFHLPTRMVHLLRVVRH